MRILLVPWRHCVALVHSVSGVSQAGNATVAVALLLGAKCILFLPVAGFGPVSKSLCLVTVGSLLLLLCWAPLVPSRWRLGVLTAVNLAISLLVLADLWFYRFFGDVVSLQNLSQLGLLAPVRGSVADLVRPADLLFLADLPFALAVVLRGGGKGPDPATTFSSRTWHARRKVAIGMALAGALLVAIPVGRHVFVQHASGLYRNIWSQTILVKRSGLIVYHGLDLAYFVRDHLLFQPVPEELLLQKLDDWKGRRPGAGMSGEEGGTGLAGAAQGLNVIVVQVEALQASVLGLEIGGQEVTPHLNHLATRSLVFSRFFHQVGQGRTSDAEFLLLCSQLPLSVGAVFYRFPKTPRNCLPTILKAEAGYRNLVFHGNDSNFWNRGFVYPKLGVDRFYSRPDFLVSEEFGLGMLDGPFLTQAAAILSTVEQPFFALLITLTSHHPYTVRPSGRTLDLGDLEGTRLGGYLHLIHYVDRALGAFMEDLETSGLLDDSLILVVGDHDGLGARVGPAVRSLFGLVEDQAVSSFDFHRRVPLLVHLPGGQGQGQANWPGGQVDLAPTILHLLGLPHAKKTFLGQSLLQPQGRAVVFPDGSAVDAAHYFLGSRMGAPSEADCLDRSSGLPAAADACRSLADHARNTVELSDLLVRQGLPREESDGG